MEFLNWEVPIGCGLGVSGVVQKIPKSGLLLGECRAYTLKSKTQIERLVRARLRDDGLRSYSGYGAVGNSVHMETPEYLGRCKSKAKT